MSVLGLFRKKWYKPSSPNVWNGIVVVRWYTRPCFNRESLCHSLPSNEPLISVGSPRNGVFGNALTTTRLGQRRLSPGALVEVDTVHLMSPKGARLYAYTLIDVHSRFAYAAIVERIGVTASVRFLRVVQKKASFPFVMIQSDNGSEFSIGFTQALRRVGIKHRHSRVRQSNDQAHVERFNRTLQEACLDHVWHGLKAFRKALKEYLPYYNEERLHMGIGFQTPQEVMQRY